MSCTFRLRRGLAVVLAGLLLMQSISCGTILHPERRGQPAGRLDPAIVALDAVGLLFFFVPGVIAFAVDFSNGTIYLPPETYGQRNGGRTETSEPVAVRIPREELTRERIEAIVLERTGKPVTLEPGAYQVTKLESVEDFAARSAELAGNDSALTPAAVRFRCQSE
jgi:hypothetical protein